MPEGIQPLESIKPATDVPVDAKVDREFGHTKMTMGADEDSCAHTADRLRSTIGSVIKGSITNQSIVSGVFAFVTADGTVHWDMFEADDSVPENRGPVNTARLAMAQVVGEVKEKMREKLAKQF